MFLKNIVSPEDDILKSVCKVLIEENCRISGGVIPSDDSDEYNAVKKGIIDKSDDSADTL